MKKFLTATAIALTLIACKQQKQIPDGFVINGTLKGNVENATVELYDAINDREPPVSTAVIKDGKFILQGKIDEPSLHQIVITMPDTTLSVYDQKLGCRFYLENTDITFEADAATMTSYFYNPERKDIPLITGSATQDLSRKLREEQKELHARLGELDRKSLEEYHIPSLEGKEDMEAGIRYEKEMETLREKLNAISLKFIKENPASPVAFDEIAYMTYGGSQTAEQLDELMNLLAPEWGGKPRFEEFKKEMELMKKTAPGQPMPDAEFFNEKGEKVKLSSLLPKGKYALVEFWASWCGPCRGEIPHLKKVKKRYPEFEMINISVDESDSDWRKALNEEKMPWLQLTDPEGFGGVTLNVFGVSAIPAGFVVDGEGIIRQTNSRGAKMDKFLRETYGK